MPDEASPAADRMYAQALDTKGMRQAPALLAWQVGNLLHMAALRKRVTPKLQAEALAILLEAGVRLEAAPDESRMRATLGFAASHGLSFCDASCFEMALRTGAQLATKDAALRRLAAAAGVLCIEL